MTAARDFARQQFDWLKQVQDDPAISNAGFALAFGICRHVNAQTSKAWPSQATLAALIGADARTVRRLAGDLHSRGHLTVEHGRQHTPNTYRLRAVLDRTSVSALTDARPDIRVRPENAQTGHFTHPDRTFHARQTGHPCPPNTSKEHSEEHSSEQAREAGASSSLDENAKAILFGEGLDWLHTATGKSKPALRTAIGQLLKVARDDAGDVLAILRRARHEKRADPIAWAFGVLRGRQPGGQTNGARPAPQIAVGMQLSKPAARA